MKALTLTQPWATLVVLGVKRWETRGWYPHRREGEGVRDRIAIHAAKTMPAYAREFAQELVDRGVLTIPVDALPRGAVVGEATLVGLVRTNVALAQGYISELEEELGDYSRGRYAWELASPVAYEEPIPARGALGLWEWDEVGARLDAALTAGEV